MEFKKVKEGSKLTYTVSGRLDTNTSPELNDDIAASLGDVKELVMDIKDLEYISSAGVRVLLSAYKVMKKQGTMVLKNVPEIVRIVQSVTGLLDFFTIE